MGWIGGLTRKETGRATWLMEDVEKNYRCNAERQSKECGHQEGARSEQQTRESKRNETTLVWTHAENARKQRSETNC